MKMYADAMQSFAYGLSAMLTTGFAGMLLSVIIGAARKCFGGHPAGND